MVERSCLLYRARVGQPVAQEINQVRLLLSRQSERNNVGIDQWNLIVTVRKITAPVIELDHLLQRELSTVVEIRCSQRDVAQHWRFEKTGARNIVIAAQWGGHDAVTWASWHHERKSRIIAHALPQHF